jgi:AraC family transcriptional regulator
MNRNEIANRTIEEMIPLLIQVQRDLDEDLKLDVLAARFGYSPFHFHRRFKELTGETPRQYVHRLRLEKAAYKLQITDESVLNIGLSVGFRNHETFSRAFKQRFDYTPSRYRIEGKIAQVERLERNHSFRGDRCELSEVRFELLRRMYLLSRRNLGDYQQLPAPFSKQDRLWNGLVEWATRSGTPHSCLAIGIFHDDPTVTPKMAQRCDACIPIGVEVAGTQRIRCRDFPGGLYGVIEHIGPASTLDQGFRNLADGIRRSKKFEFRDGPALEIARNDQHETECSLNHTDIYLPVKRK